MRRFRGRRRTVASTSGLIIGLSRSLLRVDVALYCVWTFDETSFENSPSHSCTQDHQGHRLSEHRSRPTARSHVDVRLPERHIRRGNSRSCDPSPTDREPHSTTKGWGCGWEWGWSYHGEAFLQFEFHGNELLMETRHVDSITNTFAEPEIVDGHLSDRRDNATPAWTSCSEDHSASEVRDQNRTDRCHWTLD